MRALSSDELTDVLLQSGARLVARHDHGDFLAVRRRLVFVKKTAFVQDSELRDALHSAAVTAARLQELLAQLRGVGAA
jgi:hypothetical protein